MAWGKGGSLKSCDALLKRVEENDPKLTELVILPMKTFGPADVERLSNAIASGANTNLQSISASGHTLPPESLRQFGLALSAQAKALKSNNATDTTSCGITSVAIGCKDMGDEGVIAFCEGLEESNGALLQSIDFGWKSLGKEGAKAIGKTFATSLYLKQIDISRNNDIGSEGIECFANAAKERISETDDNETPFPFLTKLILSECNIGPQGMNPLTDLLLLGSHNRSELINLTISSNPVGSEGCHETFSKLLCCSTPKGEGSLLSQLHISSCSIGDDGITSLTTAAAPSTTHNICTGLSILDLSENSITKVGAKIIAESLLEGAWPNLIELKLAKNELGEEGVVSLMGALIAREDYPSSLSTKKNSTLCNVDLTCTSCGIGGAKAALKSGAITTLRLFNNKLGSEGFHSLSPLLRGGHPSIINLDLGGNNADEDAVVALLNSIANVPSVEEDGEKTFTNKLEVLEIGGNQFGDKAMAALEDLKKVWPRLDVAHDKPVQEHDELVEDQVETVQALAE